MRGVTQRLFEATWPSSRNYVLYPDVTSKFRALGFLDILTQYKNILVDMLGSVSIRNFVSAALDH
jgi:hypothetical protein